MVCVVILFGGNSKYGSSGRLEIPLVVGWGEGVVTGAMDLGARNGDAAFGKGFGFSGRFDRETIMKGPAVRALRFGLRGDLTRSPVNGFPCDTIIE